MTKRLSLPTAPTGHPFDKNEFANHRKAGQRLSLFKRSRNQEGEVILGGHKNGHSNQTLKE
jgi:hypothetical protein